ncbi:Uncharacterized protein Fot_54299 [Forsythia ovata]|uniref:Uncharacterized protein n=1 Tax=Forsythia ovata TaxID=205694 RepID=A0ABD1PGT6_9LAMI
MVVFQFDEVTRVSPSEKRLVKIVTPLVGSTRQLVLGYAKQSCVGFLDRILEQLDNHVVPRHSGIKIIRHFINLLQEYVLRVFDNKNSTIATAVSDGLDGSLATVIEFMVNGSLKQSLQKNDRHLSCFDLEFISGID